MGVVSRIMRYLRGTLDTCLCFLARDSKLKGFVDVDLAGDIDSKKSIIGFVFTLGGITISWGLNLQKVVVFSITKAEHVAMTEVTKRMI